MNIILKLLEVTMNIGEIHIYIHHIQKLLILPCPITACINILFLQIQYITKHIIVFKYTHLSVLHFDQQYPVILFIEDIFLSGIILYVWTKTVSKQWG